MPEVAQHETPVPRLGLWVPWADTDTIGWARYTLDQRHIPYSYVRDEDIRAGKLKDKYDVLLYGHVDLELAEQIEGLLQGLGADALQEDRATPSLGTPAASDDITGGIGCGGLAELQKFVDAGGLLITLGNGSMLALEGGLVRGVRREAGGVPRTSGRRGGAAAAASQNSETKTPGRARARVLRAAGSSDRLRLCRRARRCSGRTSRCIRIPRRWLRMAYCTTCLDGPDRSAAASCSSGATVRAQPFVVSGQAWGEDESDRSRRHHGLPQRRGPRDHLQLQSAAPRPESRRPAPAVERHHQLAGDPRAGAAGDTGRRQPRPAGLPSEAPR